MFIEEKIALIVLAIIGFGLFISAAVVINAASEFESLVNDEDILYDHCKNVHETTTKSTTPKGNKTTTSGTTKPTSSTSSTSSPTSPSTTEAGNEVTDSPPDPPEEKRKKRSPRNDLHLLLPKKPKTRKTTKPKARKSDDNQRKSQNEHPEHAPCPQNMDKKKSKLDVLKTENEKILGGSCVGIVSALLEMGISAYFYFVKDVRIMYYGIFGGVIFVLLMITMILVLVSNFYGQHVPMKPIDSEDPKNQTQFDGAWNAKIFSFVTLIGINMVVYLFLGICFIVVCKCMGGDKNEDGSKSSRSGRRGSIAARRDSVSKEKYRRKLEEKDRRRRKTGDSERTNLKTAMANALAEGQAQREIDKDNAKIMAEEKKKEQAEEQQKMGKKSTFGKTPAADRRKTEGEALRSDRKSTGSALRGDFKPKPRKSEGTALKAVDRDKGRKSQGAALKANTDHPEKTGKKSHGAALKADGEKTGKKSEGIALKTGATDHHNKRKKSEGTALKAKKSDPKIDKDKIHPAGKRPEGTPTKKHGHDGGTTPNTAGGTAAGGKKEASGHPPHHHHEKPKTPGQTQGQNSVKKSPLQGGPGGKLDHHPSKHIDGQPPRLMTKSYRPKSTIPTKPSTVKKKP